MNKHAQIYEDTHTSTYNDHMGRHRLYLLTSVAVCSPRHQPDRRAIFRRIPVPVRQFGFLIFNNKQCNAQVDFDFVTV